MKIIVLRIVEIICIYNEKKAKTALGDSKKKGEKKKIIRSTIDIYV
jgi:hypothetical protein